MQWIAARPKTYQSLASGLGEFALFPEAAADAKVDGDMIEGKMWQADTSESGESAMADLI
jgi:hypothetical protein